MKEYVRAVTQLTSAVLGGCAWVALWYWIVGDSHLSPHKFGTAELYRRDPCPEEPLGVWEETIACQRCNYTSVAEYHQVRSPHE